MIVKLSRDQVQGAFVKKVQEISGQNLLACYQCGKCSAGCPAVTEMDILPSQIIRFVQLGLVAQLENYKTMWLCAACNTCAVRCPRGVDLAKIMEAVRSLVLRRNEDHIDLSQISQALLEELPPIALISNFRKFTA
ncbi:4Fe-4S dicluster domain-containing protein [candidate division KSB1 bacterium]|nr:4Fe-4S dicluster domain-containing protein [candidate division KSB1 bacterium]